MARAKGYIDQSQVARMAAAAEKLDDRLAFFGRLERVGEYKGHMAKTLFRCLQHGEIHLATPNNTIKGCGLACCKLRLNKQAKSVEERLAARGQFKLLGKPMDSTSIHKLQCLSCGAITVKPLNQALHGYGCETCQGKRAGLARQKKAAELLPEQLRACGDRVEAVGEYAGADRKMLFRCKIHEECHEARPSNVLRGQGLACCKLDSGFRWLDRLVRSEKLARSRCYLYVNETDFDGLVKIGVSTVPENRFRQNGYGKNIYLLESELAICHTIEAKLLAESKFAFPKDTPAFAGWSELRDTAALPVDVLLDRCEELRQAVTATNWRSQLPWMEWRTQKGARLAA